MKKLLLAVGILAVTSTPARSQSFAEIFEGTTNIHFVVGASMLQEEVPGIARYSMLITANILGPKMGTFPCYIGGVGVDVRTLDPAFENSINSGWSLPFLTCAPWGEQFLIQVGQSSDFSAMPGLDEKSKAYYAGVGIAWNSPNELRAKRVARQRAKEQKALLKLQDEASRVASN